MNLDEFVALAARTDHFDDDEEAIRIALYGVAGEAGSIVSEAKKFFRADGPVPGLSDRVSEEIGDLLWYVAMLSRRLGLDLDEVVSRNLRKVDELWNVQLPALPDYDEHSHDDQKLIRRMKVEFVEDDSGHVPVVRMLPLGELLERVNAQRERKGRHQLGDELDDNAAIDDGYRYHDIIHLAHATVLGWSPVLRSLMGAKRKDVADYDRVQDGARAIAVEEGLAAFVFNYLEPLSFDPGGLDWEMFKHIRRTVRGLEVESQPMSAWRSAYFQAFSIFPMLRANRGGTVECDLDARELTLS